MTVDYDPFNAPPFPYSDGAAEYLTAGWWPLPVLGTDKARVPPGFTGYKGRAVTAADVKRWSLEHPERNVAIRLPPDVVALDVDDYGDKPGAATIAVLAAELGVLPPTVVATARPMPSGKRLYRVPNGSRFRGTAGPGVDVIAWHVRYVVAWPSVHHTGAPVQWIDEASGEVLDKVPEPGELPDLPWSWLERLSVTGSGHVAAEATSEEVARWFEECTEALRPGWLSVVARAVDEECTAGKGRHPTVLAALCQVAREAAAGAYRADTAAEELRGVWDRHTAGEDRKPGEFDELVAWAVGQLAAEDGPERVAAIRERITGRVDLTAPPPEEDPPGAEPPAPEDPDAWPELVPLDGTALPPFPIEALPGWLTEYVAATATALQVPADMAAVVALGAAAAATTGRVSVRVRPGYREPLALWLAVIADPSERKSPTIDAVTAPLRALESDLAAAGALERDRLRQERRILDARASEAERAASKATPDRYAEALTAARAARDAAAEVVAPPEPRLLANDATPEALVAVAAGQGGRIALVSDEPGPLADMGRRYSSGGPSLDPYLTGWSGGPVRLDRVGREGEHLPEFNLTMTVCLQPSALAALHGDRDNRGRGVLARVLWCWPRSLLGHRLAEPPPVPERVAATYAARLAALAEELYHREEPAEVAFSDDARTALAAFHDEVELELEAVAGRLAPFDGWGGKLPGQVVRIAGLLHVAEHGTTGEVSGASMAAACDIGRYFTEHARRVWDEAGRVDDLAGARKVLRWLDRAELTGGRFTRRDVHYGAFGHGRDATADEVAGYLDLLASRGYVRRLPPQVGAKGGRPSEPFLLRPGLREAQHEDEGSGAPPVDPHGSSGDLGAFEEDL